MKAVIYNNLEESDMQIPKDPDSTLLDPRRYNPELGSNPFP